MKNLSLAFLLFAALCACNKSSHPDYFGTVKPTHPVDELWIDSSSEPKDLDPTKVEESISSGMVTNMFLRLTQDKPVTGGIMPDLAKSWDISKDGKEYTFHLREDAIWSDGKPITAGDVEYAWKRLADSATGASYAQLTDGIENARVFREQAVQVQGLGAMTEDQLLQKLKQLVPIKDVLHDHELQSHFILIDADDFTKKKEYKDKLIVEINKGILGKGINAQITPSSVMKLKSVDDHTFWVRLAKPIPYFLGLIEYACFAALPRHVIEKFKAEGKEEQWTRPGNIVVSGPFILTKEEFKQYKIFEKNPKYFNASKVKLNKVKTILIEDYGASLNAYKTGQHDWSGETSIPTDMIETVSKYKDYHYDQKLGIYYYQFNIARKPLDNVNVRKALSLAVDRKAIVENVTRQGQLPSHDFVPGGIPGYVGPKSSIFDPETAKKLLAAAGYPNGKGFPKITLKFNTSEGHRKIAEAIQQMWKSNLGIQVDIANMEWRSMIEDQNRKNFDLMRMAWNADYLDPHTFLSILLSESANNHTNWRSKKYDQLIAASDQSQDQKERFKDFLEAEKILNEDAPVMPIYNYTRAYMKKPFLKGFWPQYQDRHLWKYMWIDERWYKGVPTTEIPDEPWTE